jgi:hypothetical protein
MFMSPCLHFSRFPCLHVSRILRMKIGTIGKQQLPFVCCKRKMETANFRLFAANENGTRNLFSSVGKRSSDRRRLTICCFNKRAHLWVFLKGLNVLRVRHPKLSDIYSCYRASKYCPSDSLDMTRININSW